MTIEYSDAINFFGWPTQTESGLTVDWTLDEEDEKQMEATCDSLDTMIRYLEKKVQQRGTQKNPTKKDR